MASWTPMYNSELVWEDGAFNRHASGHPDYGWGVYNMVNHHVYGDSLYIIDIPGVGIKKLWVREKKSVDNIYLFSYADLDGKNMEDVELDVKPYESKRFVYYSLTENEAVDREPEAESWDILFTKYIDMVEDNDGNFSPYSVTGATANVNIGTNRFYPEAPDFNDWYSVPFDSVKHSPGWDWKEFDLGSFSWKVLDSNYYFVQPYSGDVYKMWFTMWEGSSTGNFALAKEMVSLASVEEPNSDQSELAVYPNPANSSFTIKSAENFAGSVNVNIVDFTGRMVFMQEYTANDLQTGISFNNLDLTEGMYVINVRGEGYQTSQKLIIR
jgi:hypothetical protein